MNKNIIYEIMGCLSWTLRSPVFIIGSGRCGTSLFIRIMNSHDEVICFSGEGNDLWHPVSYPFGKRLIETPTIIENPKKFTEISLQNWPADHEHRIVNIISGFKALRGTKKIFLLKSAMISFMIPKILSMFPDTRFIHIYRNGPSVVKSLEKKEWNKYANYFSSQFSFKLLCARYWNACIEEIEARNEELSLSDNGKIYEISYEDLCADPANTTQSIATFLGISPNGFSFDYSKISSKNFKVGNYKTDKEWKPLLEAMTPALRKKGYLL